MYTAIKTADDFCSADSLMTPRQTEQRLFTVEDAARYLVSIGAAGIGVYFIRTLISSGEIPHIKMGKRFYVSRTSLDSWIEKHEKRMR
jgi:excisionase family DNA binding protein